MLLNEDLTPEVKPSISITQADAVVDLLKRASIFQPDDTAKLMLLASKVPWQTEDGLRVFAAIKSKGTKIAGARKRSRMQDWKTCLHFFTEEMQSTMLSENVESTYLEEVLHTFLKDLGLRCPLEGTSQLITSLWLAMTKSRDEVRSMSSALKHAEYIRMKQNFKMLADPAPEAEPYIEVLPSVASFFDIYAELGRKVYGDRRPVPPQFDVSYVMLVNSSYTCRNNGSSYKGTTISASGRERHDQLSPIGDTSSPCITADLFKACLGHMQQMQQMHMQQLHDHFGSPQQPPHGTRFGRDPAGLRLTMCPKRAMVAMPNQTAYIPLQGALPEHGEGQQPTEQPLGDAAADAEPNAADADADAGPDAEPDAADAAADARPDAAVAVREPAAAKAPPPRKVSVDELLKAMDERDSERKIQREKDRKDAKAAASAAATQTPAKQPPKKAVAAATPSPAKHSPKAVAAKTPSPPKQNIPKAKAPIQAKGALKPPRAVEAATTLPIKLPKEAATPQPKLAKALPAAPPTPKQAKRVAVPTLPSFDDLMTSEAVARMTRESFTSRAYHQTKKRCLEASVDADVAAKHARTAYAAAAQMWGTRRSLQFWSGGG